MNTGERWLPEGAQYAAVRSLAAGDLVGLDHEVWEVVSVTQRPADLAGKSPWVMVVRLPGADTPGRDEHHLGCRASASVPVFRTEHYPICVRCHEPLPCRELVIDRKVEAARQWVDRYANPGVCPSCVKPITSGQVVVSFEVNLVVPLGPPVSFHTRRECSDGLARYDRKWVAAGNRSKLFDSVSAPRFTQDPSDWS